MSYVAVVLLFLAKFGVTQTEKPYKQVGNALEIVGAGYFNVSTFDRRLKIEIERFYNPYEFFYLCVGPVIGVHPGCPAGYQSFDFFGDGLSPITTTVYRFDGLLKYNGLNIVVDSLIGDVANIYVDKAPSGMSVKLLNAIIVEPSDAEEEEHTKAPTNETFLVALVVFGCGISIFTALLIAITICFYFRYTKQSAPTSSVAVNV